MKYEIYYGGKLIAQFVFKSDRNGCLDMLKKRYIEAEFTTIDKVVEPSQKPKVSERGYIETIIKAMHLLEMSLKDLLDKNMGSNRFWLDEGE